MSLLGSKIVNAYYLDDKFNSIEVHIEGTDGKIYPRIIPGNLKEDDEDRVALWQAGYDKAKLIETTAEHRRAQSRAYNRIVDDAARKMLGTARLQLEFEQKQNDVKLAEKRAGDLKTTAENLETSITNNKILLRGSERSISDEDWENLYKNNADSTTLFKLKLWLLSKEDISKDKKFKSSVRKAKSVFEIFSMLHNQLKESE